MTKAQKKQAVRETIESYAIGESFSADDCSKISGICGYHLSRITRIRPPKGTGACISVQCPEENYEGIWSWIKSIDGYCTGKNVMQAMRAASRKGTFAQASGACCASCGATERLTVDHKSIAFVEITKRFSQAVGDPDIVHGQEGWTLVDEGSFIAFHDKLADYQVLCVSCNAKKGARP